MTDTAPGPVNAEPPTPTNQPPTYLLQYAAGSDLERLHQTYEDTKAVLKEAKARADSASAALKAAATAEAPEGTTNIALQGPGGPERSIGYVTSWKFDSKALKAADPVTYTRYAYQYGSWVLR
jgi:hypothetical protein